MPFSTDYLKISHALNINDLPMIKQMRMQLQDMRTMRLLMHSCELPNLRNQLA